MKTVDFFQDKHLMHGFAVHGPHHEDGFWAQYPGMEEGQQRWELAQWGTYKHPLTKDTPRTELPGGGFQYENESVTVKVHPADAEYDIRLELRTTSEYEGYIRKDGEDWPHLLLEQRLIGPYTPCLGELDRLVLHNELRIDYCVNHMDMTQFVADRHVAQVHHYFTVEDVATGDYLWFGVPFFDMRYQSFPGYRHIDCGKADATGKLIYTIPQAEVTSADARDFEWITYDVDLLPYIRQALDYAQSQGYLTQFKFENMKITSNNIGFEMFAEYNAAYELRNISLTGYLK